MKQIKGRNKARVIKQKQRTDKMGEGKAETTKDKTKDEKRNMERRTERRKSPEMEIFK